MQAPQETLATGMCPVEMNETPIEILHLPPRAENALINGGIGSIEQLKKIPLRRLLRLRGIGHLMIQEIKKKISAENDQSRL